ncbi:hypothetical protein E3983_10310 [Legionella israelensis]|uniref:D-isomer specific 2-hydroxyacid dehydrogenase catalytic domain-containing protein n=1 Tax=Legionella israelensis TaxID=454 RepID=A0AAX1EI30_9GAMM|nr:NAD(P)-dependent oxidoreductase [Legionella israelensis]QBR84719.1 hypothetical protein E3983_10310 [Legionella israelensis]
MGNRWFEIPILPDELLQILDDHDVLLCRANLHVNAQLLKHHQIKFVATASSGIDHIDQDYLKAQGITLLSAKGANATAVADYVTSCLAFVEKNLQRSIKSAGVIGIGEVGSKVCQRLKAIGIDVLMFDPIKAYADPAFESLPLKSLYDCDVICVHANLHDRLPYPTRVEIYLMKRFFLHLNQTLLSLTHHVEELLMNLRCWQLKKHLFIALMFIEMNLI